MSGEEFRNQVTHRIEQLHDQVTQLLSELDGHAGFREDQWEREGGGGGVSRLLTEGAIFEKAGVNRSTVSGALLPALAQRIGARISAQAEAFFATGLSVVAHPRSPMVPTVHLNVRYFEIADAAGGVVEAWFGGGTDLTPTYPYPEDAVHFHRTLKTACDRHHPAFYPRFKTWCDHYFVNTHRSDERRGVGGIFFDHLRAGEAGLDLAELLEFVTAVGGILSDAYAPIVRRRREVAYGDRERRFQLARRGRYVEFNLVHDRGTLFGLQTGARVDSVLMSLPPLASWESPGAYPAESFEAELMRMLEPREWVT